MARIPDTELERLKREVTNELAGLGLFRGYDKAAVAIFAAILALVCAFEWLLA